MELQQFFAYLRSHVGHAYQTACGKEFSFTLSERNGVQLEVVGMEPRSIRSVSARRVEKWLAQFNDDPAAGPETYRNEGIEESPAYNAGFFLALARAAHNAAD